MILLVSGGCGFIGSHFIEEILKRDDVEHLVNVDCLTYAANKSLSFESDSRYEHWNLDINHAMLWNVFKTSKIDCVIHFAAESHVDNSINNPEQFIKTNINGTFNLLKFSKQFDIKKFIHVSTDEVFGSLDFNEAPFNLEHSRYLPNSPYAASKAASDLLVRSYNKTYGFPAIITNCSNNFGPRQHNEKMIPTCIKKLMNKQPIPIYGDGANIRDWIYVKDHVNKLIQIMEIGKPGKQYLIGGDNELTNLALIETIKTIYEELTNTAVDYEYKEFVTDRKGHDLRYAIDNTNLIMELGPLNYNNFTDNMRETIMSYIAQKI